MQASPGATIAQPPCPAPRTATECLQGSSPEDKKSARAPTHSAEKKPIERNPASWPTIVTRSPGSVAIARRLPDLKAPLLVRFVPPVHSGSRLEVAPQVPRAGRDRPVANAARLVLQ